jgi:hypothetical protein
LTTATDKDLRPSDIQSLSSRDSLISFFAKLGYHTDKCMTQTCSAMGITADTLQRQIKSIERVALEDSGAEPLDVYLIELTSVTMSATQGLARSLRNRVGNYLLVLTDDYERIDFVLLERSLPVSSVPMATKQVSIRPRILTVNRRNPTQVQLRVLRRFTFTEADSDAQYEKLISAYSVAEWSEPLFNNRALFSDYYLNIRLPEHPEWRHHPETAYHGLRQLVGSMRQRLASDDRSKTRDLLIEPALALLGFQTVPDSSPGSYKLLSGQSAAPIALCLAYTWNRNLDARDEMRDSESPDDNPAARVVTLLESGETPWVILTNGKIWRLYSAKAHSRATNYYEIDLDETLAMEDPNLAFRYFWLFFRAESFVPQEVKRDAQTRSLSFLDELIEESEDYAKDLGERLKARVFEDIFPHFARGYIEHLRAQPPIRGSYQSALLPAVQQLALKQEPDEAYRRQVFQGTLTFLYRLLFLLYSESRGLLPVKEERGYWEHSLARIKDEIATKAGQIIDEAPARIIKGYSDQSTAIYDRLNELFGYIDQGSREMNVPLYNGGLFISKPELDDNSPEAENARFLLNYKIPDRYLALGLDLLTRDEDSKRHDLVFIDFKSLGVRQLGSIYEGLLEFKVRVAPEKMAVVQGKKTEEVVPYHEAIETGRKILANGRGKMAVERVYLQGDVYLENDRRERKSSGSYYTPDYIVKYIVQNTVGPILEEKFEKLRVIFREAQQAYRNAEQRAVAFQKRGMAPDDPSKTANNYAQVVNELFDLKVLDPAMGSGHFLVEAVDFICDRILGQKEGFLQAFPWNPVTTFLELTRREILGGMERQGVTIDASRLTDINLFKRHVLKRCVYGVDLNPMAVELAKVSLWLDCFTLGAPLSFLNHHLKCGNSLIGTTVQEVEAELGPRENQMIAMFGGPFQGLLSGTSTMLELARTPDVTIEEAEQSKRLFKSFEDGMEPYKAALDIWVSRDFGNKLAQEYLTLVGQNYIEEIRSGGKGLPPEYREVISKAKAIGEEKSFFHWDLEFPEAFIDLERKDWKLKEQQGFDAVIGNPPYDVLSTEELGYDVSQDITYYRSYNLYLGAVRGKLNLYKLFICRAMSLAGKDGSLSFIVPMTLLGDDQSQGVRSSLLMNAGLMLIESFPQKDDPKRRVFTEAKLATTVFVTKGQFTNDNFCVRTHPSNFIKEDCSQQLRIKPDEIKVLDPDNLSIPSCTQRDWDIVMHILRSRATRLGNLAKLSQGEVNETTCREFLSLRNDNPLVLRGASISLYAVREASQGTPLRLNIREFLKNKSRDSKAWDHTQVRVGLQRKAPQNNFRRLIAAPIEKGEFCFDSVSYVTQNASKINLNLLLALLNSTLLDWYFRILSTNSTINEYQFNLLPVPSLVSDRNTVNWQSLLKNHQWNLLTNTLLEACPNPGEISQSVTEALSEMSLSIQSLEGNRMLKNRSERSHLATESQFIQDSLDTVLFRCYGLSDDDAKYIEQRLKEML